MVSKCEHVDGVRYESMPAGSVHHAKIICVTCNSFLGWQPKPENVARQIENERKIKALSRANLSQWERSFVESISKLTKLSPKQQAILDKLHDS